MLPTSSSSSASETVGVLRRSEMEFGRGAQVPVGREDAWAELCAFGLVGSEEVSEEGGEDEIAGVGGKGLRLRLYGRDIRNPR